MTSVDNHLAAMPPGLWGKCDVIVGLSSLRAQTYILSGCRFSRGKYVCVRRLRIPWVCGIWWVEKRNNLVEFWFFVHVRITQKAQTYIRSRSQKV